MTTVLVILVKLSGIAALVGAVGGSWAIAHSRGDTQARLLRQAKWLYLGGLLGVSLWALITLYGALRWGCDPVFGGFSRAMVEAGATSPGVRSVLPACS